MTVRSLKAPFPYFGGKSAVAPLVWSRFGRVKNYVEPFFGSGAMLLARPDPGGVETVNDADGMIANFWRALQSDPDAVARWADWPVNENDLHARHRWLIGKRESLQAALEADPDYCDAKVAGWWVWGLSAWIGSGWCKTGSRQLPHLGNAGNGVNRQRPHLGGSGIGQGIHTKRRAGLLEYMQALADRMRPVRVCCGDWSRVTSFSVLDNHGLTAVFLDPPYYPPNGRDDRIYSVDGDSKISLSVGAWCRANGSNPLLRIALCGYEGEHDLPGWDCVAWKAQGGMGNRGGANKNRRLERIWFSPACERGQGRLF